MLSVQQASRGGTVDVTEPDAYSFSSGSSWAA